MDDRLSLIKQLLEQKHIALNEELENISNDIKDIEIRLKTLEDKWNNMDEEPASLKKYKLEIGDSDPNKKKLWAIICTIITGLAGAIAAYFKFI